MKALGHMRLLTYLVTPIVLKGEPFGNVSVDELVALDKEDLKLICAVSS